MLSTLGRSGTLFDRIEQTSLKRMCSPLAAAHRSGGANVDAKEVDEPDRWAKTGTIIAYEIQCSERADANVRTLESQTRFAGLQDIGARASCGLAGSSGDRCAKRGWSKKTQMKQLQLDSASENVIRSAFNQGVTEKTKRTAASVYRELCTDASNWRMRVALTASRIQKMWSSWASQDTAKAKKAKKRACDDGGAGESKGEEEEEGPVAGLPAEYDEIQSDSSLSDEDEEESMSCLLCGQVNPPTRMLVVKWLSCDQCLAPHHLECTGRKRMPTAKVGWKCAECAKIAGKAPRKTAAGGANAGECADVDSGSCADPGTEHKTNTED